MTTKPRTDTLYWSLVHSPDDGGYYADCFYYRPVSYYSGQFESVDLHTEVRRYGFDVKQDVVDLTSELGLVVSQRIE